MEATIRLFESHCHLNDDRAFPDLEATLAEARGVGVERFMVIGIDATSSARAIELAECHEGVYASVGWHPNYAAQYTSAKLGRLRAMLEHPKAVAVGEIGLDYHWDYASPTEQARALQDQLALAADVGKPVIFHVRKAYDELLALLGPAAPARWVLHCFSGDDEHARRALAMGAYFGFDGPLTYPKSEATRRIAAMLPRDRVLIETDSPYLAPHPHRSKPNRPAWLTYVNDALAQVWGMGADECAETTFANAARFFGVD